jgi:hypothetical protein
MYTVYTYKCMVLANPIYNVLHTIGKQTRLLANGVRPLIYTSTRPREMHLVVESEQSAHSVNLVH